MNSVNLIPARRLQARRSMMRVRAWMLVGPISLGLLAVAYAINLLAWETDTGPVSMALQEIKARAAQADVKIAHLKKELKEQQAMVRANRSVGEQPDWASLLTLLGSCMGDDSSLVSCVVDPVMIEQANKGGKDATQPQVRPQRLKLSVRGLSRSQEGASRFVLELEKTKVFDKVTLIETKRDKTQNDEVAFDVACEMSDSGAVTK